MTLTELIEALQDIATELGEDADVRLAHQPRWPFEYSIDMIAAADGVVYIGEGSQLGYLPHAAAVALSWAENELDEDAA